MNKALITKLLSAYMYINDDYLSITTYNHVYNYCHIQNLEFNFVDIIDNYDKLYSILYLMTLLVFNFKLKQLL